MNPIFSHRLEVRWREMDALGHVNNARYLTYFETGRIAYFERLSPDKRTTVEGATPTYAASWTGPRRLRSRNDTIRFVGHAAMRRLRDVLGFQIGDGTAQIMKTIIARTRAGRKNVPA